MSRTSGKNNKNGERDTTRLSSHLRETAYAVEDRLMALLKREGLTA